MAKLLATIKAVITRIIFSAHGFIAIWQVTQNKKDPIYWCLCVPIGVLCFEGIFTLAIKKNQEWRWFCPSVFIYLSTIVPAIWLLELDKLEKRTVFQDQVLNETINLAATVGKDLKELNKMLGVKIQLPEIQLNADTWVTLIEQFLMLVLIIGRWMLPKGDLTRDQLSQLLLVYIGTAADIIEFFDSFKDSKIANEPVLVLLTLSIWSWSLLQFTIVLSATRARKPRGGGSGSSGHRGGQEEEEAHCCHMACCNIDCWGIALNILLQDAPFLTFRLLIIVHYKIITYMNIFFTCKNTLVILLQLYRLYVVHSERRKSSGGSKKAASSRPSSSSRKKAARGSNSKKRHSRSNGNGKRSSSKSCSKEAETRDKRKGKRNGTENAEKDGDRRRKNRGRKAMDDHEGDDDGLEEIGEERKRSRKECSERKQQRSEGKRGGRKQSSKADQDHPEQHNGGGGPDGYRHGNDNGNDDDDDDDDYEDNDRDAGGAASSEFEVVHEKRSKSKSGPRKKQRRVTSSEESSASSGSSYSSDASE
ncbi:transmembrane protein 26 [Uranotaenia lowii]|uniref:transmembrane protein 26 n=1 Tax=Uranotaenia lowii TaxID=190385 RepID=UPI002479C77D|nr:transmembrane protein 26 [Uranotaenia lowii]